MEQKPPPASDPVPEAEPISGTEIPIPIQNTQFLLQRVQAGDSQALDRLCRRYVPRVAPLGHRPPAGESPRLPGSDDLVQDTLIRALHRFPDFEFRHEGALQAYSRQAVLNMIRDRHAGCARGHRPPTWTGTRWTQARPSRASGRPRARRTLRGRLQSAPAGGPASDRRPVRNGLQLQGSC